MDTECLNVFTNDECCGDRITTASRLGYLNDRMSWVCPKCGIEWRCEVHRLEAGGLVRHWNPHCPVRLTRAVNDGNAHRS